MIVNENYKQLRGEVFRNLRRLKKKHTYHWLKVKTGMTYHLLARWILYDPKRPDRHKLEACKKALKEAGEFIQFPDFVE